MLFCFLIPREEYSYKINYIGMHVADCTIEYSDTTLSILYRIPSDNNEIPNIHANRKYIEAVNIRVDVTTTGIIDNLRRATKLITS